MQILVLGMHRSGTSAVARVLNLMGAHLGEPGDVKGANPENPKGFWENERVVELNNQILGAQRCLWNRLGDFDRAKLGDDRLATLRRRTKDLIIRLDAFRPWAVKDPRLSLTLPFWRPLLEVPLCILVHRNPLEVARSLQSRNETPLHVGIALWELYVREALRGSLDLPRFIVRYEDLLTDPVDGVRRMHEELQRAGVRKLECPPDQEILAFFDEDLRRHRATPEERTEFLTAPQQQLCEAVEDGSALEWPEVPPLSRVGSETLKAHDTTLYAQANYDHLKGLVKQHEADLAKLRDAEQERAKNGEWPAGFVADHETTVKDLRMAVDELRGLVSKASHPPSAEEGEPAQAMVAPSAARKTVDVIICVHNALEWVRQCLESVVMNTPHDRAHVYVVNDGSKPPTTEYVRAFCEKHDGVSYMENPESIGYTRSANRGLRESNADYVVLLNSDIVVPEGWVERIIECGESDPNIGIVGPLSNAASYQSVPDIRSPEGEWAVNPLPANITVDDMAQLILRVSDRLFPRLPFINGSCFAVKRKLIERIGLFDEETFPIGYGEENDYCIRAREAGYELAVADHGYVYHAKSRSFTHERRKQLAKEARGKLEAKHGPAKMRTGVQQLETNRLLEPLRQNVRDFLARAADIEGVPDVRGLRILYLLRGKGGGGGVHSIYQETSGMRKFGVYSQIALPKKVAPSYRRFYPDPPEGLFYFYEDEAELHEHAKEFDIVVATIFTTVQLLKRLTEEVPHVMPAYYIQDYEPWIVSEPRPDLVREAEGSYNAIPEMVCFAKTDWIRETVRSKHGTYVHKVRPSLDTSVYHRGRIRESRSGRVRIAAMVRPTTPRRSPKETMELLRTIQQRYPDQVKVTIFGNVPSSEEFQALPQDFEFENLGVLVREEVADLLGRSDVFVDLSTYQAFGRTGLEAMAVGCATILPVKGGAHEYAVDRQNALLVDTSDTAACEAALDQLVTNEELRHQLQQGGLATATNYNIRSAVVSELRVLQEAQEEWRMAHPKD